ncbi:MAG: AAA family ATPase [Acholeplasmataceae bacterium]|nr:ATP-binding protein [Acholeplasmataceae bacterium]
MLKRKITENLNSWREDLNKKILFLKGPKFVGKTTSVKLFAESNYEYVVYLNFEESPLLKSIFTSSLAISNLLKQMSLKLPPHKLIPGKTILILDEIHLCPQARKGAYVLSEEKNIDIILISSYHQANRDKFDSTITEFEEELLMSSLDLEEFFWAHGIHEETIKLVKEHFLNKTVIPSTIHEQLIQFFKEYMIVGGLPEIVYEFINNHNYRKVARLQQERLLQIKKDASSFLDKPLFRKVVMSYDSIYQQLIKEYKKFQYGVVENKGNARKFESSVLWLYDADLINISFEIDKLSYPFRDYARYDIFKVYYRDVGFLAAQTSIEDKKALLDGNFNILNDALLEQTIADLLTKLGYRLYYFMKGTTLAMEFIILYQEQVTALSVNNADNTKSKALESMFSNYHLKKAIKLSKNNISVVENELQVPLYCIMFL